VSRQFRTYAQLSEPAGAQIPAQVEAQRERLRARLARIRNVVVVASGKGGVGKSFVTSHLAALLAQNGHAIGVLDADLNGPSLVHMLGAVRAPLRVDAEGVHPVPGRGGCRVISADLLLEDGHTPLRWRGPRGLEFLQQSLLETGAVRELISDVAWGDLDALLIDMPPGTDKIARLAGLISNISLLLLVTTPSRVTESVVARSVEQARQLAIADVGVVMNMDSFCCPACGHHTALYPHPIPDSPVQYWARVPFEPAASERTDSGEPLAAGSATAQALQDLAERVQRSWS
jgi:ATP-binding protein involved in chromosome partitioning